MDPVTITLATLAIAGLVSAARYRSRAKNATVAVLGRRRAGKTSFVSALVTGEIPKGYTPTLSARSSTALLDRTPKKFVIRLSSFKLNVTAHDVSGDKASWGTWKASADQARLVCFLVSAPALLKEAGARLALEAAQQIGSWNLTVPVLLILTHVDEDPQREDPDAIRSRSAVQMVRRALGNPEIQLVSLIDPDDRSQLLLRTLEILDRPKEAS